MSDDKKCTRISCNVASKYSEGVWWAFSCSKCCRNNPLICFGCQKILGYSMCQKEVNHGSICEECNVRLKHENPSNTELAARNAARYAFRKMVELDSKEDSKELDNKEYENREKYLEISSRLNSTTTLKAINLLDSDWNKKANENRTICESCIECMKIRKEDDSINEINNRRIRPCLNNENYSCIQHLAYI